jgi:acetoin utilization protein AcuB
MEERLHAIFVREFMTKSPLTLEPGDTMADAYERMHDRHIRHLPVVDASGNLIGIFSATDLNRAYTPRETDSGWYYDREGLNLLDLRHFMSKDPLTLTPENTLKEAAELMATTKFGCLPIVAPGTKKLVGIVSYVDVLREIAKHF